MVVKIGLGIHGIENFLLKLHFLSAPSGSWWCYGYVAVIPLAHTNIALKESLWEQRVDHFVSQQTTKSAEWGLFFCLFCFLFLIIVI